MGKAYKMTTDANSLKNKKPAVLPSKELSGNRDIKKLLDVRRIIKKNKPEFIAQDTHKNIRLQRDPKWRKPRGLHSKIRLSRKGYRCLVKVGYRSPEEVRGLHRSGIRMLLVKSVNDVERAGKDCGIIISSSMGDRKRLQIIEEAKKHNLQILNIKDAAAYVSKIKEDIAQRKKLRSEIKSAQKKTGKKEAKKEEAKKEATKKDSDIKDSENAAEDPSLKEKKEMDKILTTKG